MSKEFDMDLDSILREYHAEERRAQRPAAPPAEPAPRRRREQEAAVPAAELPTLGRREPEEAPAARTPQPLPPEQGRAARTPEQGLRPAPVNAPREETATKKKDRSRAKGGLRMALLLAVFAVILAGLLHWTVLTERANRVEEPEPLRLELAQQMGEYLDQESLRSHG